MKIRTLIALALTIGSARALESSGELHAIYESAGSTWYERWNNLANQADEMPAEKRIALFSRALGVSRKFTMKPHEEEIFRRLQGIVLATPGHADHFAKIINDSFERAITVEAVNGEPAPRMWTGHMIIRSENFRTLDLLPSVENVHALGEMLSNEFIPEDQTREGYDVSMAFYAARSLGGLGIADPPFPPPKSGSAMLESIPHWQKWYAQVKAGKRTFRFIGDDTHYDIRGPARRPVLPPESNGQRPLGKFTPANSTSPNGGDTGITKKGTLPYFIALGMVVVGLVLFLIKRLRRK